MPHPLMIQPGVQVSFLRGQHCLPFQSLLVLFSSPCEACLPASSQTRHRVLESASSGKWQTRLTAPVLEMNALDPGTGIGTRAEREKSETAMQRMNLDVPVAGEFILSLLQFPCQTAIG